jgi:hypothetical protein
VLIELREDLCRWHSCRKMTALVRRLIGDFELRLDGAKFRKVFETMHEPGRV